MNNIVETINCVNGLCEHAHHKIYSIWWVIFTVAIIYTGAKYWHGTYRRRD